MIEVYLTEAYFDNKPGRKHRHLGPRGGPYQAAAMSGPRGSWTWSGISILKRAARAGALVRWGEP